MRKLLILLLSLFLLLPSAFAQEVRGFDGDYEYVLFGSYPYGEDGAEAPVLWRILRADGETAELITEDIIDAMQIVTVASDADVKNRKYSRIDAFNESDLFAYLRDEMPGIMFSEAERAALYENEEGLLIYPPSLEDCLNTEFGFSDNMWNEQPTRKCSGTPYAAARGLYQKKQKGARYGCYWTSTLKKQGDWFMHIVGYNGHLSYAAFARKDVGLRAMIRLNLKLCALSSGTGTKDDPYVLTALGAGGSSSSGPETLTISLIGDCSPGEAYQYRGLEGQYTDVLETKGMEWPFSTVRDILEGDDLTIANLEIVYTERTRRTDKKFCLGALPKYAQALLYSGIDVFNTANNHAMDFYREGYDDSLQTLDALHLAHFGTISPDSKNGVDQTLSVIVKGVKIGLIGFTYPQNGDIARITERMNALRGDGCALVIVSLHWGREQTTAPQGWQYTYAKKLIDAGADVIFGHHPHILQPVIFYNGKPILFSAGNFTFGTISKMDRDTGIFQLTYDVGGEEPSLSRFSVVPLRTGERGDYRPVRLTDEKEISALYAKLRITRKGFDALPESFMENGFVNIIDGKLQ